MTYWLCITSEDNWNAASSQKVWAFRNGFDFIPAAPFECYNSVSYSNARAETLEIT